MEIQTQHLNNKQLVHLVKRRGRQGIGGAQVSPTLAKLQLFSHLTKFKFVGHLLW